MEVHSAVVAAPLVDLPVTAVSVGAVVGVVSAPYGTVVLLSAAVLEVPMLVGIEVA